MINTVIFYQINFTTTFFKIEFDLLKPSPKRIKQILKKNNIRPTHSVFIGDNLITDIYTANKLGMYTIKVKPFAFKEFWATKIYRIIELFLYVFLREQFKEINGKSNSDR